MAKIGCQVDWPSNDRSVKWEKVEVGEVVRMGHDQTMGRAWIKHANCPDVAICLNGIDVNGSPHLGGWIILSGDNIEVEDYSKSRKVLDEKTILGIESGA